MTSRWRRDVFNPTFAHVPDPAAAGRVIRRCRVALARCGALAYEDWPAGPECLLCPDCAALDEEDTSGP